IVSRLFGKLEAQRQRMVGSEGVCATACAAAAAVTTPAPAPDRNFLRFMDPPAGWKKSSLERRAPARQGGGLGENPIPRPNRRLALHPRQPGAAPAADGIAVPLRVLVAFESFEYVEGVGVSGLGRGGRGVVRAPARAAKEENRRVLRLHLVLQLAQEVRVLRAARPGVPFDRDRSRNA